MTMERFTDTVELHRTAKLFLPAGRVTELRAFNALVPGLNGRYPIKTVTGYFDNAADLVAQAGRIQSADGCYFVLNAVDPRLLARAANKLKKADRGGATSDLNVQRRLWLPVDLDAERPAGISASKAEHEAARDRARAIYQHLKARGWPAPVVGDSGNGSHLLCRVDLPTDDGGLVERVLHALAQRFSDAAVKVDTTNHNPSRIFKLYGTRACKGDSTSDRPHRMSKLLLVPDDLAVVPDELLQQLAAECDDDPPGPAASNAHSGNGTFGIEAFIRDAGLDAEGPEPWDSRGGKGRRWILKTCPFNSEHDRGEAYVVELASGALTAGCQHNSCSWGWTDLRERFQPKQRNAKAGNVTDWPDLENIERPELPAFPIESLPGPLADWVGAESVATQTPPDLAGLLALAVCSAAVARKLETEPLPGWIEPVNLFCAVLLEPGNRKSAVFRDATEPLRAFETELIERELPSVERERAQRRQQELRIKKLETKAADKNDQKMRDEAAELSVQLAQWPEPVLPKLLVDDSTDEKLAVLLAEQHGRLASMSAEGGVFDILGGLYSKSGQPAFTTFLKAHAGDDLRPERVGRDTRHCRKPALTCCYAIQPAVIQQLARQQQIFRGRGLLGRFLYACPRSLLGSRDCRPRAVDWTIVDAYRNAVRRLLELPARKEPEALRFTPDAETALVRWMEEIETGLAEGGRLEYIRDWAGKLAGATVRLATVLHCVNFVTTNQPATEPVELDSVLAGIGVARYLVPHAAHVLGQLNAQDNPDLSDARYLVRWIRRHGLTEFARRDAHRAGQQRFAFVDDLDGPLKLLTKRGYIRPKPNEPADGPGRPASPTYEVNPDALTTECPGSSDSIDRNPGYPPGHRGEVQPETDSVNSVTADWESEFESDGQGGVYI